MQIAGVETEALIARYVLPAVMTRELKRKRQSETEGSRKQAHLVGYPLGRLRIAASVPSTIN